MRLSRRKATVALRAHSALATAAAAHTHCAQRLHRTHPCSAAGLQLEQIAATSNAAEKALLADVTEAHPDASYVELLRLFKARRRRWALVARMVHRARCCL